MGEGKGGGVQSVTGTILISKNWSDMVYFQKVDILVVLTICVTITEFNKVHKVPISSEENDYIIPILK